MQVGVIPRHPLSLNSLTTISQSNILAATIQDFSNFKLEIVIMRFGFFV